MRYLLSLILLATLAGCADNGPLTLLDDMGEVDTPKVVTLDQIEFDCPANQEARLEHCLSSEDIDAGIICDAETAILHLDPDMWDLNTEWAEYSVDQHNDMTFNFLNDERVETTHAKPPPQRFAECGCPSGCSATRCEWQENEDSNYVCTGDCVGSFCAACTVMITDSPPETATTD